MTTLYAYDFDKTMIPYDSFRRYLWHLLKLRPMRVTVLLVLRKMRLLSSTGLKKRVTRMVSRSEILTQDAKRFANWIVYDVQMPQFTPHEGTLLIISASPKIYMQYIAEALGCELLCSDFMGEDYVEMYGERKADALYKQYPQSEYDWAYACSDSESDMCWMKEFNRYEIYNKQ